LPYLNSIVTLIGFGIYSIFYSSNSNNPLLVIFNKAFIYLNSVIILFNPLYGIISIINYISSLKYLHIIDPTKYKLDFYTFYSFDNGILWYILSLIISIILYFNLLIKLDKKVFNKNYHSTNIPEVISENNEEYLKNNEKDVYEEYKLVKNEKNNFPLCVETISKEFTINSKDIVCGDINNSNVSWKYGQIHPSPVKNEKKYVKTILENVSFHVNKNECFGLLGPNGVGKSTLLKILIGVYFPTFGNIYYNGKSKHNFNDLNIGYCSQNDVLWDELTLKEHLELFLRLRGYPIKQIQKFVKEYIHYCNLDEHRNKKVNQLSGGTKRKLSVLLALCSNYKVVILDEPTAGMDPFTRKFIWNFISNIKNEKDMSIILTSHSMEEIEELCDRLTILLNGRLSCIGSLEYLTQTYAIYYVLDLETENHDIFHKTMFEELNSLFKNTNYKLIKETNSRYKYYIEKNINIGILFGILEDFKSNNIIKDYILSESSLEDIFLKFINDNNISK